MLIKPAVEIEVVVLLAPQHSSECLPVNAALVFIQRGWSDPVIELIRVLQANGKCRVKGCEGIGWSNRTQTQTYDLAAGGRHLQDVVSGSLLYRFGRDSQHHDRPRSHSCEMRPSHRATDWFVPKAATDWIHSP